MMQSSWLCDNNVIWIYITGKSLNSVSQKPYKTSKTHIYVWAYIRKETHAKAKNAKATLTLN